MPHLLLVDDNADHLYLTRRTLRSAGIESTGTQTAEVALETLRDTSFDMILLDQNLPGMKGWEFINRIRSLGIDTPVIMVTGGGSEQLAVDALKAGALDYIVKSEGYLTSLPPRIRRAIAQHELELSNKKLEKERQEAVSKVNEHARHLRDLQQASLRINASLQPRDVRSQAVNLATALLDADKSAFFLLSEDGLSLQIAASRNLSVSYADTVRITVGEGVIGRAVLQGEPVMVTDVLLDDRMTEYIEMAQAEGYRSVLAAPLLMRGDAQGGIAVYEERPHEWEPEEVALLQTLAQNVAVAYENAQLYDRLASRVTELQTLNRIVTSLTGSENLETALNAVVDHLIQLFSAASGVIVIDDKASQSRKLYGCQSMNHALLNGLTVLHDLEKNNLDEIPIAPDLRSIVLRKLQFIPDILADPSMEDFWETSRDIGVRSVLSVPLIPSDDPIGAMSLFFERRRRLDRQDRQILETVANAVAVAIQRAELQSQLLKEEAQRLALAESSRLKTEFISTVSHELRTPLTSIDGYVNLILNDHCGGVPELQREFLEIVARNSQRLSALVNDLLDVSKIESGELKLHQSPVKLSEVVTECVSMIRQQATSRHMKLQLRVDKNLPLVMGDADRLGEVVTNLLTNAIKYSEDGQDILVEVQLSTDTNPHTVVVSVRDQGIGIPPADQPNIFRKFYRVDNSTTRIAGGTGLGLSISQHLVELHGGTIWVDSEVGKGSTFYFAIPTISGDENAQDNGGRRRARSGSSGAVPDGA